VIVFTVSLNVRGNGTPLGQCKYPEDHQSSLYWRTDFVREHCFIVQNGLSPVHQRINVFWRRQLRWTLVLDAILPQVLKPSENGLIFEPEVADDTNRGPADITGHWRWGLKLSHVDVQ
jgi:hypothetical protein